MIMFFHQTWSRLSKTEFAKNTLIGESLDFMSTPLPGSSSGDFKQSMNTIFTKHPPEYQVSSARRHWKIFCRRYKTVPAVSFNQYGYLTMVKKLMSTPLPGLLNDYKGFDFRNRELGMTVCFDFVDGSWVIIGVLCMAGFVSRPNFVHSVTVYSVTIW